MLRQTSISVALVFALVNPALAGFGGFAPAQGGGGGGGGSTSSTWSGVLGNGATSGGHNPTLSSGDALLAVDAGKLQLGGSTPATDVLPGAAVLQGQNAEAVATVNTQGGPIYLSGGIGSRSFTVYDYTQLHNAKARICVNSLGTTTLTESTDWNRGASNNAAAASLGAAISGSVAGPYVTVSVVANVIYLTPKAGTYVLAITNDETNHPGMSAQKLGGGLVYVTSSDHLDSAAIVLQSNGLHGDASAGPSTNTYLFQYGGNIGTSGDRLWANGGHGGFYIFSDDYANSANFNGSPGPLITMYAGLDEGSNHAAASSMHILHGAFSILTGGADDLAFGTGFALRWKLDGPSGHFLAATDNTYDIGASGANRPRNVYIAGKLTVAGAIDPTSVSLSSGTALFFDSADGSTAPVSAANHGRIRYLDGAGWQASSNTGAYTTLASSLQTAYSGGATIATAGGAAVALSDSNDDTGSVLTVAKTTVGLRAGNGIGVTMASNTSGDGINIVDTGQGYALQATSNSSSSGSAAALFTRTSASSARAAVEIDDSGGSTTQSFRVLRVDGSGNGATIRLQDAATGNGLVLEMGSLTGASGKAIKIDYPAPGSETFSVTGLGAVTLTNVLWSTDTNVSKVAAGEVGASTGTTGTHAGTFSAQTFKIYGSSSGSTSFAAGATPTATTYTWPSAPSNGNFLQTDGSGNLSWAAAGGGSTRTVLTKTGNYSLQSSDSNDIVTNNGAGGTVILTLPTWAAGLTYTASVDTAQALEFLAPGSDTITFGNSTTAGGGNVQASTVGYTLTIAATVSGKWRVTASTGTWSVN